MTAIKPLSAQTFIAPPAQSYYLNSGTLAQVARIFDQNNDRIIGRDELQLSPQMLRQVDRNRDNMVQLFELESALNDNQLSIQNLPAAVSHQLAQVLIADKVFSTGLGSLGQAVDQNYDGYVTRTELSQALNSGRVILSGSYLVAGSQNTQPGYPTNPGYGRTTEEARQWISGIESQKMRKDPFGNPNPNTGLFTPEEANSRIYKFIGEEVAPSLAMPLADKLELIKGQRMKQDAWGNDDPFRGSLNATQSAELAEKTVRATRPNLFLPEAAKAHAEAINNAKMRPDNWGNNDSKTGLFTPEQANELVKDFLRQVLIPAHEVSSEEKLALIRSLQMKKDNWGNDNPRNGSLSAAEVKELSRLVFATYN
jgi:hypothetical protein